MLPEEKIKVNYYLNGKLPSLGYLNMSKQYSTVTTINDYTPSINITTTDDVE